ncbi:MAG TPA: hypothetical protein VF595_08775 [Tepidisphaeraceae bacterium]
MRRRVRRFFTWVALLVMVTLIAGYWFVTDRARVRGFVEQQLSRELGARVTVGDARLSIFEGLRLDDVRVSAGVDDVPPIFEAKRLHISYDPRLLLQGKVGAERVVAVEPWFRLVEDLDRKRWNFQLLDRRGAMTPSPRASNDNSVLRLPEVLVRNARFDYAQIANGHESDVSTLHLEGQFTPDASGLYRFRVQSRGGAERAFPVAEGWLKSDGSAVHLTVNDVEFIDEIKTILPAQVRRYWDAHQLAGRLDELRLDLFRKPDRSAGYRVAADFRDVNLTVPPTTWMGPGDKARVQRWQDAYTRLGSPTLGGSAVAASIVNSMTPAPLRLEHVDARFVFTDEQVRIEKLLAYVEGNALLFSGTIEGYSAEAAMDLRVQSPPNQRLVMKESPTFVAAMPWPVQEIYYRFRPVGTADLHLQVTRAAGAEYPTLRGELNVRDANFVFDRFPYPVGRATGKFRFGNDPITKREMLEIVSVTGRGPEGGPNADAQLEVHGTISPLDETAGADISVVGKNVRAERRLIESLPPLTRKAVLNFDAHQTGTLPSFRGDFGCDVHRAVGLGQPWLITTRLDLADGSGVFKGFPYPLSGVSGSLKIYEDHVDIQSVKAPAGGGTLELNGAINWIRRNPVTDEPIVQPDLTIRTRGVAIDDKLLGAMPPSRRAFLKRLGLGGLLDIDGRIEASAPDSEEPAVDLKAKLTNGFARPPAVRVAIDDLRASVRIKGERADVDSFTGTLAGAAVTGTATAEQKGDDARVSAEAQIAGLRVEAAPLVALPPDAAKAIRSLHAKGDIDVTVRYGGDTDYEVAVRPRQLTVTPEVLPLRIDKLAGRIVVTPANVRLEKVTGRYGDAAVSLDGRIDPASGDAEVALAARDLKVDAAFSKALPAVLQNVVSTLGLSGPIAIDCPKLVLKQPTTRPVAPSRTNFESTLWLQKGAMDVSADVRDIVGRVNLTGEVVGDTLTRLDGRANVDDMTFAGRPVSRVSATLAKRPGEDLLRITGLSARVAGGQVGGQIETMLDRRDPRFALDLRVRGARVAELTGDPKGAVDTTLNGSLAMEGRWDDPASRRGRGDLLAEGKEMVKIPVVFGLMQVANLTVPSREPIKQAAVRYSVEGQRIRLDQIDLRSTQSVMAGDGMIDFAARSVDINLALADSAADAFPLFGDLIKNTRQDLLRIRLRGTLTGDATRGQAFNIFNSTVDEVKDGK